ncbi:hypothetical protein [Chroococcidiopsis sp. CCNUC1]|uniref:hypothetical protein n=1 Tax=Chroococcidiopsis sp. CCNUC1 TaxID=2653189 RepID=UPI0003167167|nr:hypothetical protein [Chroococcidiopsis sp. CCNUC1]PSB45568.1 hypothetical protein C7B80_16510 [Cyanosarcina cf. burmensis CCALA 770]URD49468.1 hypothetical protein M5J74_24495 [Chroococcidiopsis sp. CCNUC1]
MQKYIQAIAHLLKVRFSVISTLFSRLYVVVSILIYTVISLQFDRLGRQNSAQIVLTMIHLLDRDRPENNFNLLFA